VRFRGARPGYAPPLSQERTACPQSWIGGSATKPPPHTSTQCASPQQAPAVRVRLPQEQAWPCSRHNHEWTRSARGYWVNRLAVGGGLPRLETTRRRCRILATRTTVLPAQSADTFESRESCAHRRCTRCHSF